MFAPEINPKQQKTSSVSPDFLTVFVDGKSCDLRDDLFQSCMLVCVCVPLFTSCVPLSPLKLKLNTSAVKGRSRVRGN